MQIGSVFFASTANAQNTSELGIGLGGTVYKGELAPNYRFGNNRPAGALFYKKDISPAIALRAQGLLGFIRADDHDSAFVNLPLHQFRNARMKGRIAELSFGIDYNFLNYYDQKRIIRWTPYFFVGGAVTNYSVTNRPDAAREDQNRKGGILLAVPFGVGAKVALSYHWNLGLEFGARKTFTDRLDAFEDVQMEPVNYYSNPYDKDWYIFNAITLSYTFYKIKCPPVYRSMPGLLD